MRLTRYINESEDAFYANVNSNCSQILKLYKRTFSISSHMIGGVLFRGLKKAIPLGTVKSSRTEKGRRPKDTPLEVHNWLNQEFKRKFGWSVRDGISCTTSYGHAHGYGKIHVFLPFDGYKYVYSEEIGDLYIDLPGMAIAGMQKDFDLNEWLDEINEVLDSYTDKGIAHLLVKGSKVGSGHGPEIMFNAPKYYLFNIDNASEREKFKVFMQKIK